MSPPCCDVRTETDALPAVATSAAVICAVKRVLSTLVVVRGDPFHRTTALGVKPVPETVSANAAAPAVAVEDGASPPSVASGCCTRRSCPFSVSANRRSPFDSVRRLDGSLSAASSAMPGPV